jgi:Ser/Thr protein kinase RdoA (MazF antagonist)
VSDETQLLDVVRSEFALPARSMTPAGRGVFGAIWRLRLDSGADLAVKVLATEPSAPVVALEVAHTRRLAEHGVRVAASLANRHHGYLSKTPGGWLRIAEWITGQRPEPTDPDTSARLGEALGRMHVHAAATLYELDGSPPDPWHHQPPSATTLTNLVLAAERADPRWAGRLDTLLPTLHSLAGITKPPTRLMLCHRDLHPDNVLRTGDGRFAALDWDNLGPADPSQELGSVLLHWFADHTGCLGPQIAAFLAAYRAAGGPGRLTGVDDFSMHLASRLNFLARQLATVADPQAGPDGVRRAAAEIEESLQLLPSIDVLERCLAWSRR